MLKIKGVNLGNWLVLEKWMNPTIFEGTEAEDEYYLTMQLPKDIYEARLKIHRSSYITERDFLRIKSLGLNSVRIPIPYFIFGDRPPFLGCISELDNAFNWAEHYGLSILLDLHTAPDGQNGFDNGGICGVCKWAKNPKEVEFVSSVLERLSQRYGHRKGLLGIQVLNEPNTTASWDLFNILERYPAFIPEQSKGSEPISFEFLYDFYQQAYFRIRQYLPKEKYIVFHDGFDMTKWDDFMQNPKFENVILDTHQYLMLAEIQGCEQSTNGYIEYIRKHYASMIENYQKKYPIICGEWCIFNSFAAGYDTKGGQSILNGVENNNSNVHSSEELKAIYTTISTELLNAWNKGSGYYYWSYKLLIDTVNQPNWKGWDCWDFDRAINHGWLPLEKL